MTLQYGSVDEQLEVVAQQLANITELSGGFDAIGFSQGVLCPFFNAPIHVSSLSMSIQYSLP